MHAARTWVTAAAAAGALVAGLLTAPAASAAPTIVVAGYQRVFSDKILAGSHHVQNGTVSCPAGTKVVGGGALIDSVSIRAHLQFSYPATSTSWFAAVVNNAPKQVRFYVYAVCAKNLVDYSIVDDFDEAPADSQSSETTACPTGTVPLGGGGGISEPSQDASINSSIPTAQGWRIDANNDTSIVLTKYAYAVCAQKPKGHRQVIGTATPVTAGTQGAANATCPGTTKVFGGGAFSSSGSVLVALNSTVPTSDQVWRSYEDNGAATDNTVTSEAVCAAVSG